MASPGLNELNDTSSSSHLYTYNMYPQDTMSSHVIIWCTISFLSEASSSRIMICCSRASVLVSSASTRQLSGCGCSWCLLVASVWSCCCSVWSWRRAWPMLCWILASWDSSTDGTYNTKHCTNTSHRPLLFIIMVWDCGMDKELYP